MAAVVPSIVGVLSFLLFGLLLLRRLVIELLEHLVLLTVFCLMLSSAGQNLVESLNQLLTRLPTTIFLENLPEISDDV